MMEETRLQKQLRFLVEVDQMKNVLRQTLLVDKSRRENDAEHSWHLAMMAIAFARYAARPVRLERVLKMTLVHDLVEIYAGDTFAYDKEANLDKEQREGAAADKIFAMIPEGGELRALWEEFDEGKTADASFAAALDRLQPLLSNHLNEGHTWKMGKVDAEAVYRRISPLKEGIPALWDIACHMIEEGIQKGYIQP